MNFHYSWRQIILSEARKMFVGIKEHTYFTICPQEKFSNNAYGKDHLKLLISPAGFIPVNFEWGVSGEQKTIETHHGPRSAN